MQDSIKKLKEYTDEVKLAIDSLYREGSADRVGVRQSEIVNSLVSINILEKLEKLIEVEVENGKKLDALLLVKQTVVEDKPKTTATTKPAK